MSRLPADIFCIDPRRAVERRAHRVALASAAAAALFAWIGCMALFAVPADPPASPDPAVHEAAAHSHHAAHGGMVTSVGDNHLEAVWGAAGRVRVYLLGQDETQLVSLAASALDAEAQPLSATEATPLRLSASPQSGEPAGAASRFEGRLPAALQGQACRLFVTVPLGGRLYRARFAPPEPAHTDVAMPSGLADKSVEAERKLFLTPGGLYSQADIAANGSTIPSVKYAGFVAAHNMNPPRGARLCPITNTEASSRLAWIVGGKAYTFCCPPCLREFVSRAKTKPTAILPPDAYVKR